MVSFAAMDRGSSATKLAPGVGKILKTGQEGRGILNSDGRVITQLHCVSHDVSYVLALPFPCDSNCGTSRLHAAAHHKVTLRIPVRFSALPCNTEHKIAVARSEKHYRVLCSVIPINVRLIAASSSRLFLMLARSLGLARTMRRPHSNRN